MRRMRRHVPPVRRRWLRAYWRLTHWPREWIERVRSGVGYVSLPEFAPPELCEGLPRMRVIQKETP